VGTRPERELRGHAQRRHAVFIGLPLLSNKGGAGAVDGADGWSCIGNINCAGGFAFDDYEVFEAVHPVTLLEHEYWEGSAGAGRWRGGLGIRMRYRLGAASLVTSFGDADDEAYGLFGGTTGQPNRLAIHHQDGRVEVLPANAFVAAEAGSVVEVHNGGGGGFGDPRERPADRVRAEVRDGLLTPGEAERLYGPVRGEPHPVGA
jgi:N-methylhydantoinase B